MHAGLWHLTRIGKVSPKSGTVAAALLLLISANAGAVATYSIVDLGTLGGPRSMAYGLNDLGQVVGWAEPVGGPPYHAFLWDAGAMSDLGTLGGVQSAAMDINNAGQITGWSFVQGDTSIEAFSTTPAGPLVGLGTPPGSGAASATGSTSLVRLPDRRSERTALAAPSASSTDR